MNRRKNPGGMQILGLLAVAGAGFWLYEKHKSAAAPVTAAVIPAITLPSFSTTLVPQLFQNADISSTAPLQNQLATGDGAPSTLSGVLKWL